MTCQYRIDEGFATFEIVTTIPALAVAIRNMTNSTGDRPESYSVTPEQVILKWADRRRKS